MINWANFVSQMFNGLVLGALLALISSGLTIIYGTLGVLNLAHGAMFMLGGYAGYVAYTYTQSFVVAVIAGSLFVMVVGVATERLIIRHFYNRPHEDQLLVTFGLGIVFVELVRLFFGSLSQVVPTPGTVYHKLVRSMDDPRGEPPILMAKAALLLATEPLDKVAGRVTYSQLILKEFGWIAEAKGTGTPGGRQGSGYSLI